MHEKCSFRTGLATARQKNGCGGCYGNGKEAHSQECRRRMKEKMAGDPEGREQIEQEGQIGMSSRWSQIYSHVISPLEQVG